MKDIRLPGVEGEFPGHVQKVWVHERCQLYTCPEGNYYIRESNNLFFTKLAEERAYTEENIIRLWKLVWTKEEIRTPYKNRFTLIAEELQ